MAEEPQTAPDAAASAARQPHWSALAIVLLVIGLLILVPSGLCTALFGVGAIVGAFIQPNQAASALSSFLMMLVVGGIPIGIGAALVYAALRIRRGG